MRRLIPLLFLLAACGSGAAVKTADPSTTAAKCPQGYTCTKDTQPPATTAATPATEAPTTTVAEPTTEAPVVCPLGEHATPINTCVEDPTTTTAPPQGSREHPFSGTLSDDDWSVMHFTPLVPISAALVHEANKYNDPLPAGQKYVATYFTGTYKGSDSMSGTALGWEWHVVGSKAKLYDVASVSDGYDIKKLNLLEDQPDVIAGGRLAGNIIFAVDANDTNLLLTDGYGQFVKP
jgi:hypothetical protein